MAYRVLGSVTEAEDVVQDAWLRWSRADVAAVSDPEGYLVRVTTRLAVDVILVSDGGGFTRAPRMPIRGVMYVARAVVVLSKRRPAGSDARLLHVNGGPGIVIYSGRTPVLALTLHLADGAIKEMHVSATRRNCTGS